MNIKAKQAIIAVLAALVVTWPAPSLPIQVTNGRHIPATAIMGAVHEELAYACDCWLTGHYETALYYAEDAAGLLKDVQLAIKAAELASQDGVVLG